MWNFGLVGRTITLNGKTLKIEEQLSEVLDRRVGQRNALIKARNTENNTVSLIKMRYQIDPDSFDLDDTEKKQAKEDAWYHFCDEVEAARLLSDAGLGPQYLDHLSRNQPAWMPFPGGYADFLVMKVPPGQNLDEIQDELTDRQLASIRTQLAHILETLRQKCWTLIQQHPSYLNYDMRTNKLYLVDLADLEFTDPDSKTSFPIDEESPFVEAFNVWRAPYQKPEKVPDQAGKAPSSNKPAGKKQPSDQTKKENRPPWKH